MKLVTKLTIAATLASFMLAGLNVTWGNAYSNSVDGLQASHSFGLWIDVNESASLGWEGSGLKVGFAGPAGTQVRLGFDPSEATPADVNTTLGMSRDWWTSGEGSGWSTSMSTALDWNMTGTDAEDGDFILTMNLGFGF